MRAQDKASAGYLIECWEFVSGSVRGRSVLIKPSDLTKDHVPKTHYHQPGAPWCQIFYRK